MSCYVVSPETLSAIVYDLEMHDGATGHYSAGYFLKRAGYDLKSDLNGAVHKKLLRRLNILNRAACRARYGSKARDMISDNYPPEILHRQDCSEMQVYKALQCFCYQCFEADWIENHPLIKAMNAIKNNMAAEMIARTPEYKKSAWGI